MRHATEGVTEALLESAKKEFLAYGFKDASLRRISAASGVSTNSIYTRFRDKADLFDSVVREPADELMNIYRSSIDKAKGYANPEDAMREGKEGADRVLVYIFEHKEIFQLLFRSCAGTNYENYYDELSNVEEEYYQFFAKKYAGMYSDINPFFIHVHCRLSWQYVYEILSHDLTYEQARAFMKDVGIFQNAGWRALLGAKDKER
jgi:AcrR family transcriptional regulator